MLASHRRSFALAALLALGIGVAPALAQDEAEAPPSLSFDYPQEVRVAGQDLSLHQPFVTAHDLDTGAISLRVPVEAKDPLGRITWGSVDVNGKAHIDQVSRLFLVDTPEIAGANFPALEEGLRGKVVEALPADWPKELLLRLELLTARAGATARPVAAKMNSSPPKIHVRRTPAVLVQIDGEPEFAQIKDFPVEVVTNTMSDLYRETRDNTWYLLLDGNWATAPKLKGPWTWLEGKLPITLTQLPIDHSRGHIRRWIPGTRRYQRRTKNVEQPAPGPIPEVIVDREAAELVLLEGDPLFTLIPRVKLMVVANTASDILFHPRTAKYFILLGGRWFQADEIEGPWGPVYGALPDEFKEVPRDHVRGHIVWSVPGTPEAAEAAARASLVETALIHERARPSVRFGSREPVTSPIEGVKARIITNTEDAVFKTKSAYWACVRGAWFRSEDARSSWRLVTEMPDTLAAIPEPTASHHVASCKYLGPGEKGAYFAVTDAYHGVYLDDGTPVYGTGWRRRGTRRGSNWYPHARTYGDNRWYDPISGHFQARATFIDDSFAAVANEWSEYNASYGKTRSFSDRYQQGGKRPYGYDAQEDSFDLAMGRWDPYGIWGNDAKTRNGLPAERFPLGDRSAEVTAEAAPMAADAEGGVYRLVDGKNGKVEMMSEGAWAPAETVPDDVKTALETLERLRVRPGQIRKWAKARSAPLPVNPVVTPQE